MVVYYFHGIYRVRISGMFLTAACLRSIFGVVVFTKACVVQHSRQRVSGVLYIPFIHSRHNAKDRSL